MAEKFTQIYKNAFAKITLALVLAYFIFSLIVPMLLHSNMLAWDGAGMYFSAWYQKEYLFPRIIGWNPFFFLGYAQNQFYPPLYPYLSALLAQIMPLDIAFKLILAAALLLTPLSFHFLCRSFGFSQSRSAAAAAAMAALLFAFPNDFFGGNIHSTINIGLYANALALPLFFFLFGSLERLVKREKKDGIIIPALLLSAIILSHTVSAIAALVLLFTYAFLYRKSALHAIAKILSLSLLLSAFWSIPAIAKYSFATAFPIGEIPFAALIIEAALLYLMILTLQKKTEFYPAGFFVLALMALVFFATNFTNSPLHPYRFTMFIVLLAPMALLSLLRNENYALLSAIAAASLIAILLFPAANAKGPEGISVQDFPAPQSGRMLILTSANSQPSPHMLQHILPMRSKVNSARGVFVESSKNSPFIFDIEREIDAASLEWGVVPHSGYIPRDYARITELLPVQMELFNITRVVSPNNTYGLWEPVQEVARYSQNGADYNFLLFRANDSQIAKVLTTPPRAFGAKEWDDAAAKWFLSPLIKDWVLVNGEVPRAAGTGSERLEVLEASPTMERLVLRVDSNEDVPVLIKMSYYPNWNAYSGGKKLHIYKASPYLMLVYGHGIIELKYEDTPADTAGNIFSIAGIVILAFLAAKSRAHNFG